MKDNLIILLSLSAALFFQHCKAEQGLSVTPNEKLIWISIDYSGGVQCDSEIYTPPDVKEVLKKSNVQVLDIKIVHHLVCAACTCPDYAATHYALILKSNLSEAIKLGFEEVEDFNF